MSFSSRVISEPVPPVSSQVRHLGLLLWSLPILLSLLFLHISPRSEMRSGKDMVNGAFLPASSLVTPELPDLVEPASFARIGAVLEEGDLVELGQSDEPRFPLVAEAWRPTAFSAGKITAKADFDDTPSPLQARTKSIAATAINPADVSQAATAGNEPEGASRTFQRVKVVSATAIQADNLKIILAGVEPLPQEATCRRLDGVMQSCIERAEHRLAVLLQARNISCQLSKPLESGAYIGRCLADRIDIAGDLLRHKLAQRRGSTMASNNL
jgi:hypothetical protein